MWNGKTNEVCNIVLPFQVIEQVDEPREEQTAAKDTLETLDPVQLPLEEYEEVWTGDYIFENEWQSFRTKKDRSIKLRNVAHECTPGRRKIAVEVADIFGNETMTILEVGI